jgi:uncharacterized protein YodC (DUF2158 family)
METYTSLTDVMVVFSQGNRVTLSGYESSDHVRCRRRQHSQSNRICFHPRMRYLVESHFVSMALKADSIKCSEIPTSKHVL